MLSVRSARVSGARCSKLVRARGTSNSGGRRRRCAYPSGTHNTITASRTARLLILPRSNLNRRAGVYTAEEAVSETRTVLKTLREAYIQQMKRLRVMLQTARLEYVRSLRAEKEQYCSINSQARSGVTVRERRQLRQLKAYAGYRRAAGRAAVMARQLHKRRARVREHPRGAPQPRCRFAEGGVRCDTNALPAARYCLKHILNDPHQVLFKMCGDTRGVVRCREVVARGPLPSAACRYHTGVPTYTPFTLKKDESDSDSESRSSEVSHPEELPELEFKTSEDVVEESVVTEPMQYD